MRFVALVARGIAAAGIARRTTICRDASDASPSSRASSLLSPQDRPDEWEPIGINYPITSGVNLWVSGDGRAEIDYGGGQFRLAGDTNVHVARLDDRELALFIAQGRVIVRVRVQDPGEATRIDTPNTQVALTRPGLYRVDVAPDRQATTLIVREGEAQRRARRATSQQVLPGQAVSVDRRRSRHRRRPLRAGRGRFRHVERESRSPLRRRCARRRTCRGRWSAPRISTATERWQTTPDYGAVWFPNVVAPDWAPYRDGYWTDVGGWGPTWVDSAPWGYAPFHYGRWAFIGGRWGWCPGGYVARPVWAPALVAWYGGPGWGVSRTPAAGRSTAGCRSAGASRITPAGADARPTAGRATTGPTAST